MDYFELFELPFALQLDKKVVRQKYLELSRRFHPDHNVSENDADEDSILEKSANLNKAYKTLTNDEELIAYVLRERGLLEDAEKYSLPPAFLMEMMELNEAVEDATGDTEKTTVREKLKETEEEIYAPVKSIIETYREGAGSEEALLSVKEYYFKKKYLQRLAQQLEQKL